MDERQPRTQAIFPLECRDGLRNRVGNRQTAILAEKVLENQTRFAHGVVCRRASRLAASGPAMAREGKRLPGADDQVIDELNLYERQRFAQHPREAPVARARLHRARWVIMGDDQARGIER